MALFNSLKKVADFLFGAADLVGFKLKLETKINFKISYAYR